MFLFSDDTQREELLFEGVHTAVKRILDAGLTAIVDLHTISYGKDEPRIGIDQVQKDDLTFIKYKTLVEKFAAQLKIYDPQKVAFELINEPNYACDDRDTKNLWTAQLAQLHGAARAVNTDITLILTGACYGSAAGLTLLDPTQFKDTNIIWSFHNYEPFIITHQSAGWVAQPVGAFKNLPYPPNLLEPNTVESMPNKNDRFIDNRLSGRSRNDAGWYIRSEFKAWGAPKKLRQKMQEPFELVATWAKKHTIDPSDILMGEFGFIAQEYNKDFLADPDWRISYLKDNIALAEKYGFGWPMWSYSGAFGIAKGFDGKPMTGDVLKRLELTKLP